MNIRLGTENDKEEILHKYPGTAQVMTGNGYLIVAVETDDIIGFAFIFRREIPAPVGGLTEDFINVIEIFDAENRNKGIASLIIDKCKETAKENGSYQIRAYCDINNIASHRLWAKNNFGISPVKMSDGSIYGSYVTYKL